MVADVALGANFIDNPTQHKSRLPWESWCLPTTLQLHFRALQTLYLEPLSDHASWQLFQSCNSCAATFAVQIWTGPKNQHSFEEQF